MAAPAIAHAMKEEDVSETIWKLILITIAVSLHPRSGAVLQSTKTEKVREEDRELHEQHISGMTAWIYGE